MHNQAILYLNLHREFFAQVAAGTKCTEYRSRMACWGYSPGTTTLHWRCKARAGWTRLEGCALSKKLVIESRQRFQKNNAISQTVDCKSSYRI